MNSRSIERDALVGKIPTNFIPLPQIATSYDPIVSSLTFNQEVTAASRLISLQ